MNTNLLSNYITHLYFSINIKEITYVLYLLKDKNYNKDYHFVLNLELHPFLLFTPERAITFGNLKPLFEQGILTYDKLMDFFTTVFESEDYAGQVPNWTKVSDITESIINVSGKKPVYR